MKLTQRLFLVLMMVFGLTMVPLSSAAGDPVADGGAGAGGDASGGTGGSAGGDPGTGGGAAVPGVSTPRVILAGFTTEPAQVVAGQDFTVSFTLRNTSTRTRVQNMLVSVASDDSAFLPADGSSSMFISRIRADQVETRSMRFHSLPSLEEKPYRLTLTIQYEDAAANAFSATETASVRVRQNIRADASVPQLMPPQLTLGQDASLTFSIFNQGKTKLYNAKAAIKEGQALTSPEVFVGTIDPGSSGAVDMTVSAAQEAMGPITVTVSYEDVDGNVTTMDRAVEVAVVPPMPIEEPGMGEQPGEETGQFPVVPVLIAAGLLGAAVVTAVAVRRRRRRRAEQEDLESLAELGEDPLIGPEPR